VADLRRISAMNATTHTYRFPRVNEIRPTQPPALASGN